MDKEIIDKVMFDNFLRVMVDNFLRSVPTMVVDAKDRKTISAYGSIDIDDLKSGIDTFKKVPEYGELLKQVKKQKEVIDKLSEIIYELYDLKETTGGYPSHYVDDLVNILKRVSK